MNKTRTDNFIAYMLTYYGKAGLYPIEGITPKIIKDAICEISLRSIHPWSGGDSFDREAIRDYILANTEVKK